MKLRGWQQHNKPIELGTNEMVERYVNYLNENPVKEGYVEYAEDYVYAQLQRSPGGQGR